MMGGRKSREKGKRGERETADEIRQALPHLADKVKRGWQTRSGSDAPDVAGLPGYWLEVKTTMRGNAKAALEQATRDKTATDTPLAVLRDTRKRPYAVMWWDDMLRLIAGTLKENEDGTRRATGDDERSDDAGGGVREARVGADVPRSDAPRWRVRLRAG